MKRFGVLLAVAVIALFLAWGIWSNGLGPKAVETPDALRGGQVVTGEASHTEGSVSIPGDPAHDAVSQTPPVEMVDPVLVDDVHLERIRRRIALLRDEGLGELTTTIFEESWFQDPGAGSIQKSAQMDTDIVLSNRRFAKLREILASMSRQAAAEASRRLVAQAIARADETVARALLSYRDPQAPRNGVSALGNKWGLCAGILLASEFCDTETVLEAIESAEQLEQSWIEAIEQGGDAYPPSLVLGIRNFCCLQPSFKITAAARAVAKDSSLSVSARARLAQAIEAINTKTVPVVSWDAKVTSYDFPHLFQGLPVDTSKGVEDFVVYQVPVRRLSDRGWQQQLWNRVRQALHDDSQR